MITTSRTVKMPATAGTSRARLNVHFDLDRKHITVKLDRDWRGMNDHWLGQYSDPNEMHDLSRFGIATETLVEVAAWFRVQLAGVS